MICCTSAGWRLGSIASTTGSAVATLMRGVRSDCSWVVVWSNSNGRSVDAWVWSISGFGSVWFVVVRPSVLLTGTDTCCVVREKSDVILVSRIVWEFCMSLAI